MDIKISWSEDMTKGYHTEYVPLKDLWQLTQLDYSYSLGSFKDGYRNQNNYQFDSNAIALDIDDGCTLDRFMSILKEKSIKAFIATTKSHQKDKNGKICDRYRVIMPTDGFFPERSLDKYKAYLKNAWEFFYQIPDPLPVKDPARFYFGNEHQQVFYTDGNPLRWSQFKPKETIPQAVKKTYKKIEGLPQGFIEWAVREATPGNRNNILFRAYMVAKDHGYNPDELVNEINSRLSEPLPEHEIKAILRK